MYQAKKLEQSHIKSKIHSLHSRLHVLNKSLGQLDSNKKNTWQQYNDYVRNTVPDYITPVDELLSRFTNLTSITSHLCTFFGHECTDRWESLFGTWCEFIDLFTQCNMDYEHKQIQLNKQQNNINNNKHIMQTHRKSKSNTPVIDTVMTFNENNNKNSNDTLASPNKRRASRELSNDTIRSPLSPINPNKRMITHRNPAEKLNHAINMYNPVG